jgi:hypothetical protein
VKYASSSELQLSFSWQEKSAEKNYKKLKAVYGDSTVNISTVGHCIYRVKTIKKQGDYMTKQFRCSDVTIKWLIICISLISYQYILNKKKLWGIRATFWSSLLKSQEIILERFVTMAGPLHHNYVGFCPNIYTVLGVCSSLTIQQMIVILKISLRSLTYISVSD